MIRGFSRLSALAAVGFLLCTSGRPASAAERLGKWHEDTTWGYKLRVPEGWLGLPLAVNERWIVARFHGDQKYVDPSVGWWADHRPELKVIVFTEAAKTRRGAKIEEKKDGSTDVKVLNPFKDYRDYLKRTREGEGGWHFTKEEKTTVDGVEVDILEAKVERGATMPLRIVAWVYHLPDAEYAIEMTVLERHADKLVPFAHQVMKTFKAVERTRALPTDQATTGGPDIERVDEDDPEAKPAERRRTRFERHERYLAKALASVPAGWTAKRHERLVVISHTDEKHTQRIVDQASGLLAWMDEEFGYVGTPQPIRIPIVRICKDWEEESALWRGTSDGAWNFDTPDIYTHRDVSAGTRSYEFQWVNGRVAAYWFRDKAPDLTAAMPPWLQDGINGYLSGAIVKGKRVEFRFDDWDKERVRNAIRSGKAPTVRDILLMERETFWKVYENRLMAASFIRWLLDGPGARNKRTKDFLRRYVEALEAVLEEKEREAEAAKAAAEAKEKEAEAAAAAGEESPPEKTEEELEKEEEERFNEMRTKWKDDERKLLQTTFGRAAPDLTEKDWETIQASFAAFSK